MEKKTDKIQLKETNKFRWLIAYNRVTAAGVINRRKAYGELLAEARLSLQKYIPPVLQQWREAEWGGGLWVNVEVVYEPT